MAVFLMAATIAGAWVLIGTPNASQTVRVDAPVSQPTTPSPPTLAIDELLRQALHNATNRPLCEAPPIEVSEDLGREVEKALATAPVPSTAPSDAPAGVINVHRRMVPC